MSVAPERGAVDRLQRLEDELNGLKSRMSRLQEEVGAMKREQQRQGSPVDAVLAQRGLPVLSRGERAQMLLQPDASPHQEDRLYGLMRRYSFRLFLRELIRFPDGNGIEGLSRYCSPKTVRSYLQSLAEIGIVELGPDSSWRLLRRKVPSFGPTLEWYVSEVFRRELLAPAIFGVRLGHTLYGGDYDVLSLLHGHLVYVEVKSSPPRGIELQAVSAFLGRLEDLRPHTAIFMVDTELRMKDKIVPLFIEVMANRERQNPGGAGPVERLVDEIFHIGHSVYLINSRKGIYSNLRLCFRDFLRHERRAGPPISL